MACPLFGAKPLSKPMLVYCQLDPWEQTSVKFQSTYKAFQSWKYRLRNGGHFVQGEMSYTDSACEVLIMLPQCDMAVDDWLPWYLVFLLRNLSHMSIMTGNGHIKFFLSSWMNCNMMASSNGNIFHVTGPLWGKPPVTGGFPSQKLVTWSFDVFFDLHLNKQMSKYWWGWWFETPSRSLWGHCNECIENNVWARVSVCPFGIYFQSCKTAREINTKITLMWGHK